MVLLSMISTLEVAIIGKLLARAMVAAQVGKATMYPPPLTLRVNISFVGTMVTTLVTVRSGALVAMPRP